MRKTNSKIKLSDHFTPGRMIRFSLPSIGMMIFSSIYGMVDGYFVSNYAGATPFASLNLVMPFIMILSAVGFMFGTGGTALVSMTLGIGNRKKANEIFSLLTYTLIVCGVVFSIFGITVAPAMSKLLGATPKMLPYSVLYIRINMVSLPFFLLQNMFQSFTVTAEKPKLGLAVTIMAGCTNMFLDWLFVGVFGFGLAGAAWATVTCEIIGGTIPLIYFFSPKNKSLLRLGRTHMNGHALLKTCTNGSSEFLSDCASSIVGMLYNLQLMKYFGQNGVAAYGVIMYVNFIFVGIYFGYSMGMAPVTGYNYGAQNHKELRNVFRTSMKMIAGAAIALTVIAELLSKFLVNIFVGYDPQLSQLTVHAFRIYVIAFLFMGFNIYGSSFFTALNNGLISAILSVARSLVMQLLCIYLLPLLIGPDGLWGAIIASDGVCLILTIFMLVKYQKKYKY
ncbi:MAG: MATE family efflux transporter [Lachnospiraceae bacterium]|uniref:Multidrug export protein MepA n=1 Tax=Candidatus Weimeria bifida TaxID=2599074 RepID=A0A6N7IX58_9FIRM|nr:MATE family efflux transporter [Candidatus Weimeria bifida]RRF97203.1 MAG: MATE family efflux transporter [Lachnospiraceae bacterium]